MKTIALLVNVSMPLDFKTSVQSQKENQNFIKNYEHSELKPKKFWVIPEG